MPIVLQSPAAATRALPPESRLLLATVGERGADGSGGHDPVMDPGELSWGRLHALMLRERATSVAWDRLPAEVRASCPPEIAEGLDRLSDVGRFRQAQMMERLEQALALRPAGTAPPVLLKGAALARTCYADPAERPMLDLDLLVEPATAWEWHRRLRGAGWKWDEGRNPRTAFRRHHHLPPLELARGAVGVLEVHTGLFVPGHPFALDASELRKRSVERDIGGQRALVPEPACHLAYLGLHFAWSHMLSRAGWRTFRDVAALSGSGDFAWSDFVELARASRGAICCYWTLRLAARLAAVPVPGDVLEELRPAVPEPVLAALERHFALKLFSDTDGCPSATLDRLLWRLAMKTDRAVAWSEPWALNDGLVVGAEQPDGIRRALAHLGNVPAWSRYARKVLDPWTGGSPPIGAPQTGGRG